MASAGRPSRHSVDWLWQADWSNTLIRRPSALHSKTTAQRPYLSWDVVVIGWTRFNQVPLISLGYSALDPSARARRAGRAARDPARLDLALVGAQCMRIVLRHVVRFISFIRSFVRSFVGRLRVDGAGELQLSLSCRHNTRCILISYQPRA